MSDFPLDQIIEALLGRGFKLPPDVSRNTASDNVEWQVNDYHPQGSWNQVVKHAVAHALIAIECLLQIQGARPVLQTNGHGDWYMEIDGKVHHPAIHWDGYPHDCILRSIHAWGGSPKGYIRGHNFLT